MVKAFAYLRVSGKGQLDGDGFSRQLEAVKKYATANGIKIVEVFKEEAIPGKTELDNRPALLALLEALASNGTRLILIEKLDRLARNLMVQETIIADLQKRGFELISVAEPDLLQDDPSRKMMRQIFGAVAEYERAMIVANLKGARQRKKAKVGRCEGIRPFGDLPGEEVILARLKELRAEDLGFDRIAAQMNAERHPTRTGKPWHGIVINRILKRAQKKL